MGKTLDISNELAVARFLNESKGKFVNYMTAHYGISEMDAEDFYQEACIAMWENIQNEKLKNLTVSAFTYLLQIGINKVNKKLGREDKEIHGASEIIQVKGESEEMTDEDSSDNELRHQLVSNAVNEMKHSKCKEILWSYYRDRLSMDTIAKTLNMSNANVAKTRKNQCMGKLKDKILELFKMYDIN